jgi:hypothetical protein
MDKRESELLIARVDYKRKRQQKNKRPLDVFLDEKRIPLHCEICGSGLNEGNWDHDVTVDPFILNLVLKHGFVFSNPKPAAVPGCAARDIIESPVVEPERPNYRVCIWCYRKIGTYVFK